MDEKFHVLWVLDDGALAHATAFETLEAARDWVERGMARVDADPPMLYAAVVGDVYAMARRESPPPPSHGAPQFWYPERAPL